MDETGLPQLDTGLLNNTQPNGVQGHATGGAIDKNLSAADMVAAMIYGGHTPPKFQYAGGGPIKSAAKWAMNEVVPMMEHLKNKAAFTEPSAVKGTWYHGSPSIDNTSKAASDELHANGITQFDPQRSKTGLLFASDKPDFASSFAEQNGNDLNLINSPKGTAPAVYPVLVHAKNPFDYENPEHVSGLVNQLISTGNIRQINPEDSSMRKLNKTLRTNAERNFNYGNWDDLEKPHVIQAVKDLGHDGMYVNENGFKNIGVFDPGQFKSAIGNQGTYDVTNPDIRKAAGGSINFPSAVEPTHMAEGGVLSNAGKVAGGALKHWGPLAALYEFAQARAAAKHGEIPNALEHAYGAATAPIFAPEYEDTRNIVPQAMSNVANQNWSGLGQNAKDLGISAIPFGKDIQSYFQSKQ